VTFSSFFLGGERAREGGPLPEEEEEEEEEEETEKNSLSLSFLFFSPFFSSLLNPTTEAQARSRHAPRQGPRPRPRREAPGHAEEARGQQGRRRRRKL
jgi:hypothetical protein